MINPNGGLLLSIRGPKSTKCQYLTAQQAADFLGVHRDTIYAYVRDGKIPVAGRVGRGHRFLESDLRHWVEAQSA